MEEQELRKYEITFLLREDIQDQIQSLLLKNGAQNVIANDLKKVQLSYPIQKENFAFMGSVLFEVLPSEIAKIKNELKLQNQVLRFLITKIKKQTSSSKEKGKPKTYFGGYKKEKVNIPSTSMVSNETLEKQIEEILK